MLKRIGLAAASGLLILGITAGSAYADCKPEEKECTVCW
jgi:hypothetical protein